MSDISSGEDCDVNETAIVGLNNDVKISSVLSNEPELDGNLCMYSAMLLIIFI